ncbi:MAG TPA: glycosyltransferase family 4 protein [Actinomycetota bacterium]|nr:glycosyltransferase family 4 protein [Actinomycetota bacterium]
MSVVAGHWSEALRRLGLRVRAVAGEGRADRLLPGLGMDVTPGPDLPARLAEALDGADLVVVENVCSLPRNPAATAALAGALAGRPAILHHHDLPWQREELGDLPGWPPDDPAWRHVTINEHSRKELADRGLAATTVYSGFPEPAPGRRELARARLGVVGGRRLLLQPTRAIPRKNIPAGLAMAEALGADYWLTGPSEDGYGPELERLLAAAGARVHRRIPGGLTVDDAYAACDAVVLPSTWEGFGAPLIEASLHRRPLAVGDYPVARELAAFGFRWFPSDDPGPLRAFLDRPDLALLERNHAIARRHFSLDAMAAQLVALLTDAGWGHLLPAS